MSLVKDKEQAEIMDVTTHPDDCTTCRVCGTRTELIAALVDHNEEECPHCGQRYRVYEE